MGIIKENANYTKIMWNAETAKIVVIFFAT